MPQITCMDPLDDILLRGGEALKCVQRHALLQHGRRPVAIVSGHLHASGEPTTCTCLLTLHMSPAWVTSTGESMRSVAVPPSTSEGEVTRTVTRACCRIGLGIEARVLKFGAVPRWELRADHAVSLRRDHALASSTSFKRVNSSGVAKRATAIRENLPSLRKWKSRSFV